VPKIGNLIFIVLAFALSFSATAYAEDVIVQSTVDRNNPGLGDTLQLTVSVQTQNNVEIDEPRLSQLQGFNLVNAWTSSSTSSKLVRGPRGMQFETVRRQEFNYLLSPQKQGNLQIPSVEVIVDGKVYRTKPILITVSAQGSGAGQLPPSRPAEDELDEAEQLFQQLLQRRGMPAMPSQQQGSGSGGTRNAVIPKNPNESFFIHLDLDKKEVFEGEQITAEWSIYTRGNILSLDRVKFPDLKGFWKEIIEEVPSLNFSSEVLNGIPYRRALLASHALFPIKAGKAYIDEYRVKANVQVPTGPLGQFGFGQAYTFNRASPKTEITVKPLPTTNKPQDFTGAVGQFDVKAAVEGNQFPVNQPFSYKIRFEGTGNAKLIEIPPLELPAGFELFDTKSESKFFKNGRSFKEFEVLVIPRQVGNLQIPAFRVSLFDPKSAQYYSRTVEGVNVVIVPSAESPNGSKDSPLLGGLGSNQKNSQQNRIPSLPSIVVDSHSSSSFMSYGKWFLVVLVWLSSIALTIYKAIQVFNFGNQKSNLRQKLSQKLKPTNKLIEEVKYREVGVDLANACYAILGNMSKSGSAHLELGKLIDQLPTSVRRELEAEIKALIDQLQTLCFAPDEILGKLKSKEHLLELKSKTEKILSRAIDLIEKDE
jgi:hypothetical protein